MSKIVQLIPTTALLLALSPPCAGAQAGRSWQAEWDKALALGKKEGKVVVSIPASAELRKKTEAVFQKRFGIDVELFAGRGGRDHQKDRG